MSDTERMKRANRTFRKVKIRRKPSTNEWVVKRVNSKDSGFFTDDLDDAISTASRMENEPTPSIQKYLHSQVARKVYRKPRSVKNGRHADIRPSIGNRKTGDMRTHWSYCAYLKFAGKTVMKIEATSETYDRLLAAVDLWTRGASMSDVERAIGKHTNG